MKKRFFCLLLVLCLLLPGIPCVSAADLIDCNINILFGAALFEEPVKQSADGQYYAPVSWIGRYSASMHEEIIDGDYCYYPDEQKELKNFARRIFFDPDTAQFGIGLYVEDDLMVRFVAKAVDYGTFKERADLLEQSKSRQKQLMDQYFSQKNTRVKRGYGNYVMLYQNRFSACHQIDGEYWVPMAELLPLMDVRAVVSGNGQYLCMEPVQDTILRFLYRHYEKLDGLIFSSEQIVGKEVMIAGGWLVSTFTGKVDNLWVFDDTGRQNSYKALFTDYLMDNEAYLASFGADSNPDMEYLQKVANNAGDIKSVLSGVAGYLKPMYETLIKSELDPESYTRFFKPAGAVATSVDIAISLNEYYNTYANQVDDHRKMLDAVYRYRPNYEWSSYQAAKTVTTLYSEDADKAAVMLYESVESMLINNIYDRAMSTLGPWYYTIELTKVFCAKDYEYVVSSADIQLVSNTAQYAYSVFDSRLFNREMIADAIDDLRLSLMMALVSSRHAYKTYWGDSRQDDIDQIDSLLAELYWMARWDSGDAIDRWLTQSPKFREQLKNLKSAIALGDVVSILTMQIDPESLGLVQTGGEKCYTGTIGDMEAELVLDVDWDDSLYCEKLTLIPNDERFPIAYGLTTDMLFGQLKAGMQDLYSWTDHSKLSPEDCPFAWMGPYEVFGSDPVVYEASCIWEASENVYYQMVVTCDGDGDNSVVTKIVFYRFYF